MVRLLTSDELLLGSRRQGWPGFCDPGVTLSLRITAAVVAASRSSTDGIGSSMSRAACVMLSLDPLIRPDLALLASDVSCKTE